MAIFNQIPKSEIKNDFTHYGLAYGIYPIYISNHDTELPSIAVRNWFPEWGLDLLHCMACLIWCDCMSVKITGEIK